jgi:hypothetical protein
MTGHSMALLEHAEKHADGDYMKEPGQFVLQRLMELEVAGRYGAARQALVAVVQEAYLKGASTRKRNEKTAFRRPKLL